MIVCAVTLEFSRLQSPRAHETEIRRRFKFSQATEPRVKLSAKARNDQPSAIIINHTNRSSPHLAVLLSFMSGGVFEARTNDDAQLPRLIMIGPR